MSSQQSATLQFKCALITGGGGGIGFAIAQWLQSIRKEVIIAGRTDSKLQSASKSLNNCPYYSLDTGDVASIPSFSERITVDHPELDCLVNNAGVQRPLDVNHFAVEKADQEIDINIRGPMHLTIGLLPHLKAHKHPVIVNVSSVLGYNPFSIINPVYNGTKAWVHFWTMNLRTQLQGSGIKVVEIAPPTVATDLHRERENPDDNKKENNQSALSLDEFMEDVKAQWGQGKDVIAAGMAKGVVQKWYDAFGEGYEEAAKHYR